MPLATAPPAPTAASNPACAPGTTVSVAAAPTGTTYYWQTVANGSTTTNNAATALPVTASGTYYVSAFDAATSCWSNTSSIAVVVDAYIPPTPLTTINPLNVCSGATTAPLTVTPAASSGQATITFATNYTVAASANVNFPGSLTIPAGATITSSSLVFSGFTTAGSTYYNDMSYSLSGASTTSGTFTVSSNVVTGNTSCVGRANIPTGITRIANDAFLRASGLTSAFIPNTVTSMGTQAFQQSGLTTIDFEAGSTLTSIASAAFQNIPLTSIVIPDSVGNDVGFD
jgi:hypothetical protein